MAGRGDPFFLGGGGGAKRRRPGAGGRPAVPQAHASSLCTRWLTGNGTAGRAQAGATGGRGRGR
jgi:hypothetical protein